MRIQIELTAKQERHLIQLGLASLTAQTLDTTSINIPIGRGKYKKRKQWSKEQHNHYAETMAAKWGEKRAEKTAKSNDTPRVAKWASPEFRREYGKRWRAKRKKAKKANGLVGTKWTAAHRRNYAAVLLAKGQKLNKLKSAAAKRTNGKPLDANGTTRHRTNGIELRHDGKPYVQPGKKWSEAHRRNFVRSYKRVMAKKKRLAAQLERQRAKMAPAEKLAAAASVPLGVAVRQKASRPNAKWTDAQRARFRETLAKKKADGWVPKRTRGAQK